MPDKQEHQRALATLEAALAAELTGTRTMMLAVASAPHTSDLEPTVAAWISDWQDFHLTQTQNPVLKAALPVAINQVSPQRVAAAVWHFHRREWQQDAEKVHELLAPGSTTPPTPPHTGARIKAAQPAGKYASVEIVADGRHMSVPACVAEVLWDIANGSRRLRFRPETMRKLKLCLPWVANLLQRDYEAKVIGNRQTYTVPKDLSAMVDGTNAGTSAATG